jgi:hypothetical protein
MKKISIIIILTICSLLLICEVSEKSDDSSDSNNPPEVLEIYYHDLTWDGSTNPLPTDVSCKVTDPDGISDIQSVTIEQGHTGAGNYPIEYALADDGAGIDIAAGDGTYSKTFVQDLSVNALWYTNNTGHYWVCMATDKAGAFYWKKITTNPCCTTETGSGVNTPSGSGTNTGTFAPDLSDDGYCTYDFHPGLKVCHWFASGFSGLKTICENNLDGTYNEKYCQFKNYVGLCFDNSSYWLFSNDYTAGGGKSHCDVLGGTWQSDL